LQAQAAQAIQAAAAIRLQGWQASGYGRSLQGSYYWGSNGSVARAAVLLQAAWKLSGDQRCHDAIADQLSYLYGRNPYGRSQVTGQGIRPPQRIHHRPSAADGIDAPWPGLLVGGGQSAGGWVDQQEDYRTNETAINWQASLVYALAVMA
jgi:endoglucanase